MPSPNWLTIAPVVGSSCKSGPPPVVAQRWPSLSKASAKIWYGSVASGVPTAPPFSGTLEQLVARRAAADEEAAVGRLGDRHRPEDAVALVEAGGERLGLERLEHRHELGRVARRRRVGHALLRLREQRVGRGLDRRRRRDAEVGRRRAGNRRQRAQVDRRRVLRHVGPGRRQLVVAGHVGGQRQERVGVPGLALVDHRAGRLRHLVLPDLVGAAVLGDVQRHVLDARAARVVGAVPLHLVVGARADLRDRQLRRRGDACRACRSAARYPAAPRC